MKNAIEKLTNILKLESEQYEDKAVLGGLARYAKTWVEEAQAVSGPEATQWIADVADQLRAYSELAEPDARRAAVSRLLETLGTTPAAPPPAEPAAPAEPPQPSPPAKSKRAAPGQPGAGIDAPITALQGVGSRQAKRLANLGIHTIRDMVYLFPRRHDDYTQLKSINRLEYGEDVTIIAQVRDASVRKTRSGRKMFKVVLSDGTGAIESTWFNQPYLADKIEVGNQIVISGTVDQYLGRLCFTAPEWEPLEENLLHTGRLVPVYPLTSGIGAKWLRGLMKRTIDYWAPRDGGPPAGPRQRGCQFAGPGRRSGQDPLSRKPERAETSSPSAIVRRVVRVADQPAAAAPPVALGAGQTPSGR